MGWCVVCLKGGDFFVFGCGGEEVFVLVDVEVLFEIVLGVLSGLVVFVYVGILIIYCHIFFNVYFVMGYEDLSKMEFII